MPMLDGWATLGDGSNCTVKKKADKKYAAKIWDFKNGKFVDGELSGMARDLADKEAKGEELAEREKIILDFARHGNKREDENPGPFLYTRPA